MIFDTISPIPENRNASGAPFITSISAKIPYAIPAGTDLRRPSTIRDALALENPSLDADVGTLINGSFLKKPQYLAASTTLPPPIPSTACAVFGNENASCTRSSIRTVSISIYWSTSTPLSDIPSITVCPNISINPLPNRITTL